MIIKSLKTFFLIFFFSTSLLGNNLEKKNFLVLMSFQPTLPWSKQLLSGMESLSKKYNIEYHLEYLDKIRTDNLLTDEEWVSYLQNKYKLVKFDAILLDGGFATKLFKKIDKNYLEDIPVIQILGDKKESKKNTYILSNEKGKKLHLKTIDMMLRHNPDLEYIYLIKGQINDHALDMNTLKEKLKDTNVEARLLDYITFNELYNKVQKLPENSAIFYNVIFKDKINNRTSPYKILESLTKNSNVPIYSPLITFINRGIIGGYLLSSSISMQSMIEAAMDYIKNKEFKEEYLYYEVVVDWNILNKFDIDESLVDKNTKIINKPKTILNEYFYEVVTTLFIIALLVLFIINNLFFIRKLKRLNKKLRIETETRIENQKMLSEQARLSSMGEMIGNIAHQWRQPLNRINSNVSVLSDIISKDECKNKLLLNDKLDNIESQTNYMSNTIENFQNFFKPNKKKENFQLNNSLKSSFELLDTRLNNIDLKFSEINDNISINGYESEFVQVVLSILNNAIDNFEIKKLEKPKIEIEVVTGNKKVFVKIKDNGGGINKEIIEKVFDPYFSTKDGKNYGLGLYISKMIIENSMKGLLQVSSENAETVFTLMIPND